MKAASKRTTQHPYAKQKTNVLDLSDCPSESLERRAFLPPDGDAVDGRDTAVDLRSNLIETCVSPSSTAAGIIAFAPIVVLFLILQRSFTRGLTAGAVK
ncbi:hypothetical protein [Ensifer soli]|uniref:hypothetical protein n=1 Tax=Ciceribacter sp. sgz301302 TaxID=3342379 RepID=UPI0035B7C1F5